MIFKSKAQREQEEMFARMEERLKQRGQIERVITPGRLPKKGYTEKEIARLQPLTKVPLLKRLLKSKALKPKARFKRVTRRAEGIKRLMALEPLRKPLTRILSPKEKALIKLIQARQSTSISNPQAVLQEYYKNRWAGLRKAYEENQKVSFATQTQLEKISRIQNKGRIDNMRKKRQIAEMNILRSSMSMFKAHLNLDKTSRLDFTGVDQDNILRSPSLFKENPENNILRKRPGSRHILDLGENTLKF